MSSSRPLQALALHGQRGRRQIQLLEVQPGQLAPAQAQVEGQAQQSPVSGPKLSFIACSPR